MRLRPWPGRALHARAVGQSLRGLGGALALGLAGFIGPAAAEVAGSISLTSDYQYRGVSLSEGLPAISLTVNFDQGAGVYAGATATGEATADQGPQILGYVAYLGWATPKGRGITWDVGVTGQTYNNYVYRRYTLKDLEIYTGLRTENLNAYVYVSPDYFGEGLSTLYLALDPSVQAAPRLRLFTHAGVLARLAGAAQPENRNVQWDFRAGLAWSFSGGEARLAWSGVLPNDDYLGGYVHDRQTVVLGVSLFF